VLLTLQKLALLFERGGLETPASFIATSPTRVVSLRLLLEEQLDDGLSSSPASLLIPCSPPRLRGGVRGGDSRGRVASTT